MDNRSDDFNCFLVWLPTQDCFRIVFHNPPIRLLNSLRLIVQVIKRYILQRVGLVQPWYRVHIERVTRLYSLCTCPIKSQCVSRIYNVGIPTLYPTIKYTSWIASARSRMSSPVPASELTSNHGPAGRRKSLLTLKVVLPHRANFNLSSAQLDSPRCVLGLEIIFNHNKHLDLLDRDGGLI